MAEYLSLADVIAIHEQIMRRLGSAPNPLRSASGLESAIMRPQMAAWHESADLIRQAALLGIGISQAQAFLDGNKRTAYLAMTAFLRLNGLDYAGAPLDLARRFERFAERSGDPAAIDDFDAFLRANIRERG